jgi:hypothetical protein
MHPETAIDLNLQNVLDLKFSSSDRVREQIITELNHRQSVYKLTASLKYYLHL